MHDCLLFTQFEHSNCDDRIKTLEVELRTALDENERLRMENNSLAENFKRVAASTEDAIEMQKNITKASSTIEELKQTVASLADQVWRYIKCYLLSIDIAMSFESLCAWLMVEILVME